MRSELPHPNGDSTFVAARISRFEVTSAGEPQEVPQFPRTRRRACLRAELQSDSILVSRRAAQLIHSVLRERDRQASVAVHGRGVSRWPDQLEFAMRGCQQAVRAFLLSPPMRGCLACQRNQHRRQASGCVLSRNRWPVLTRAMTIGGFREVRILREN